MVNKFDSISTSISKCFKKKKLILLKGIQNSMKNYGVETTGILVYFCPSIKRSNTFTLKSLESFLKYELKTLSNSNDLEIYLEFRTFEPNGLVFYHNFQVLNHLKIKEHLMLSLFEGRLTFELNTYDKKISFQHRLSNLNNGQWHKVYLVMSKNVLNLTVDFEIELARISLKALNLGKNFYFGGVNWNENQIRTNVLHGFVGCLQNLKVNSNEINSNNAFISSSDDIILNSCKIVNHCSPNPCENGMIGNLLFQN
jgi:hypothetical protein